MLSFSNILSHGTLLCTSQTSSSAQDMAQVLISRLHRYQVAVGRDERDYQASSLDDLQHETATEALLLLDRALSPDVQVNAGPAIGVRDMGTLRTLLSIVLKWGAEPRYTRLAENWPGKPIAGQSSRIIDLTSCAQDYAVLRDILLRLFALIYPASVTGRMAGSGLALTLMSPHLAELIRPCVALGWLPKSLSTTVMPVVDEIRPMIMRLITSLPAFQVIPALAAVMDSTPNHVRKACSSLLSRQILRPDGLHGLYNSMFDLQNGELDEAPLEKLNQVYRLLSSVPSHMPPEDYFSIIVPRLVDDIATSRAKDHNKGTRASAFVLSHMLSSNKGFQHLSLVTNLVKERLHRPFQDSEREALVQNPVAVPLASVDTTLSALANFVANCDPAPSLISMIISPVLPALYSISEVLQEHKTADPMLRDSVHGLLMTWGRIIDDEEGATQLLAVAQHYDASWHLDGVSQLSKSSGFSSQSKLSMYTPETLLHADKAGDFDPDANVMELRPDPKSFAIYVKSINRPDIASDLFVRILEAYQASRSNAQDDSLSTLLYLQLIVQLQAQIPPGSEKSDILKKPERLLIFIKGALEAAFSKAQSQQSRRPEARPLGLHHLHIVDEPVARDSEDSDDEDESTGDEEIASTAIDLLLSILEIHPHVSVRNAPVLNDIFELLEPLALGSSQATQALAREARLVITARLASTSLKSIPSANKAASEESVQDVYQKALELLQDPILPVRAHGILLLRQLVTSDRDHSEASTRLDATRPLVPAILSIFRQSLQHDDSYIFLNAVQGLSAMVETYGKEVLTGLVADYCQGLEGLGGSSMTQTQVDVRVRIGEALGQVIVRCGTTLGTYANLLIPRIFAVIRAAHFPATLRVSAISLLAQCTSTYALAIAPYIGDLADAMVDLLQVERSTAHDGDQKTMDEDPTSASAKVPPMRRSALHLLSLLTRACMGLSISNLLTRPLLNRMRLTLEYVAATDMDPIARLQAHESLQGLDALQGIL